MKFSKILYFLVKNSGDGRLFIRPVLAVITVPGKDEGFFDKSFVAFGKI